MENANILSLEQLEQRFKAVAARLPRIAGNEVVNFALDNFKRQGFLGDSFQPWRPRKTPTKWGTAPKRNNGRAIGVLSGRLRRGTRIIRESFDETVIANDAPYAKPFNNGFRGAVHQVVNSYTRKIKTIKPITNPITNKTRKRKVTQEVFVTGHNRKINQNITARPFLGQSQYLNAAISRVVTAEIMKAFKQ